MQHRLWTLFALTLVISVASCSKKNGMTYEKELSGIYKGPESCSNSSSPEITFTISETGSAGNLKVAYTDSFQTVNATATNDKFKISIPNQVVTYGSVVTNFSGSGYYNEATKQLTIQYTFYFPNVTATCNATLYK
jgi:hypothetical protein